MTDHICCIRQVVEDSALRSTFEGGRQGDQSAGRAWRRSQLKYHGARGPMQEAH
jgi:hypothetical protein